MDVEMSKRDLRCMLVGDLYAHHSSNFGPHCTDTNNVVLIHYCVQSASSATAGSQSHVQAFHRGMLGQNGMMSASAVCTLSYRRLWIVIVTDEGYL